MWTKPEFCAAPVHCSIGTISMLKIGTACLQPSRKPVRRVLCVCVVFARIFVRVCKREFFTYVFVFQACIARPFGFTSAWGRYLRRCSFNLAGMCYSMASACRQEGVMSRGVW